MRARRLLAAAAGVAFGWLALAVVLAEDGPEAQKVDFLRDVRPILAEHCWKCHGQDDPESGLRLTSREAILGRADGGKTIVVPGDPDASELVRRIEATDDERMPPEDEKPLSVQQRQLLRQWVAEGAVWANHWAFEPVRQPQVPPVRNRRWVRNPIDCYVLARLEQRGWEPSPEADRYTLIRRLYYDLVGLPPPVDEVDRFVADTSPDAYERLVDRLLSSPHFGERWGRHWLDLAHYADSDGYEKDRARPDAYRYRDWVIEAINEDIPYDRFTIEQLAGDLLPDATADQKLATAFLRQTLTNEEGGVDQEEYRIAAVFDRTETVGTVWLGLTIGCARCHDHKYDPVTQRDYYQLFAFFNNSEEVTFNLPVEGKDLDLYQQRVAPLEAALAERYRQLAPGEKEWETNEHRRILAQPEGTVQEVSVKIVQAQSLHPEQVRMEIDNDAIRVTSAGGGPDELPAADTYQIEAELPAMELTGLKLYALADAELPQKGPGWAPDGNFVLTGLHVEVVDPQEGAVTIALHRPSAGFAASGFGAERVALGTRAGSPGGWAVKGKTGQDHWIQWRTYEPIAVTQGTRLRVRLEQHYGDRHLLGRLRLVALTGGYRGLHLDNEEIAGYLEMYPEKRVARMRERLFDYYVTEVIRDEEVARLRREIAKITAEHRVKFQSVRAMGTPLLPRPSFIFHRGEFLSPTVAVQAGTPAVLPPMRGVDNSEPTRLDLARWLVSPDNPLTSRVFVNHVWQHLFGAGLVRTPNDFGMRGELPTHPELLDWLASQVQTKLGWSRKQLIRMIVCSATYRQASARRPHYEAADPENRLLFRQNRFRLEAETVRDVHLAAAGLLSERIGGPSVFPPMPEDLAALSYANNFTWTTSRGEDRYRRGMYTFFKRTIPHPNLTMFDAPDANLPCVQRTVSNTPLQALMLLNNEVHVEAAQALAADILRKSAAASDTALLVAIWRRCLARPPQEHELAALETLLASAREYYSAHVEDATAAVGSHHASSIPVAEQAAWVVVARTVLNTDEMITRE
ncbi:MAG: hypothetical protein KatS3mg109_1699 [Pirellulaceae bacterium]|nr:MAG: hypothetical protein KatS3mg109_1699 [Pirellulaceae bacterium]